MQHNNSCLVQITAVRKAIQTANAAGQQVFGTLHCCASGQRRMSMQHDNS